ncbi:hypothetical protein [Streptomyces sp. NPDC093984]|uniref:hypothetical protein n=1 Tax=Streptomyces sp. NPDC093984 TaxID=3366052 RepID=UPI00381A9221
MWSRDHRSRRQSGNRLPVLARAPRTARDAGKANLRFGYSPASISATTLPVDLEEVMAAMRRHHPELRFRR